MKTLIHNLIFLTGASLMVYGISLLSHAAAFIVAGVYVVALAIMAAPVKGK